jgi:hypothetical protein
LPFRRRQTQLPVFGHVRRLQGEQDCPGIPFRLVGFGLIPRRTTTAEQQQAKGNQDEMNSLNHGMALRSERLA